MERSDQQVTREGEKLDVQIPQHSGETHIDQDDSASNSNLYDVCISRPKRDTIENKKHPKGLLMVKSGNKEEMGPGGLGEGLQTKKQRRSGATRSTSNQQSLRGETMVAMGQRNFYTMVKPLEGQVCPRHKPPGPNPL
jgi:hypothetical protein